MYKILLISTTVLMFSGCSYFTFNATMCDNIHSDPHNMHSEECRAYREEEAAKAFENRKKDESTISEIVEFNKLLESNSSESGSDTIEFKK